MADDKVTVNEEQKLYVIPANGGYSCLGFDVAFDRATKVHQWIIDNCPELRGELTGPRPEMKGTLGGYLDYVKIMAAGAELNRQTRKRCEADLTPQLVGLEGQRVEVVDNSGTKRRFIVGKSTGWMPIHLEIARRTSRGGSGTYGTPFKSVRIVG